MKPVSKISSKTPVIHLPGTGKVTPAKAQQLLHDHGMQVSVKEAQAIVDFLYTLAKITTQS